MTRLHPRGIAIVALGCVLGWGLAFWFLRRGHEVSIPMVTEELDEAEVEPPPPVVAEAAVVERAPAQPRSPTPELASDGIPIMQAHGDSTANGPKHPHPITPQHLRIFRENALLGALNGAVDAADPEGLRRLHEQYQAEYPEDGPQLQAGYALIADCLDRLDAETVARARRYFDEERASTLRRYVKRYCL